MMAGKIKIGVCVMEKKVKCRQDFFSPSFLLFSPILSNHCGILFRRERDVASRAFFVCSFILLERYCLVVILSK